MSSPLLAEVGQQVVEDLASDEPLQATQDILLRQSLRLATGHIVHCPLVVAESADRDHVQ